MTYRGLDGLVDDKSDKIFVDVVVFVIQSIKQGLKSDLCEFRLFEKVGVSKSSSGRFGVH